MKIFLTGASGLLGMSVIDSLSNLHEIHALVHRQSLPNIGVTTASINLDNSDDLKKYLVDNKIECVVHAVALTNVDECERNPQRAYYLNLSLAEKIAYACANVGCQLVHISTDHVFGGFKAMSDENDEPFPLNVYAKTKLLAEGCVLDASKQSIVIRTNFFGWGPVWRRSFSDYIIDSLKQQKKISLFNDVFYTPIFVGRLVSIIEKLVISKAAGLFHVVGDERISKYQFGRLLAEKFSFDVNQIVSSTLGNRSDLTSRPMDMSLSNKKTSDFLKIEIGGIDAQIRLLYQSRH